SKNCGILDQRFKDIPLYPGLKHFPNGVTSLQNVRGFEYATILHLLAPLVEDLLPNEYQEATLKTIRVLAHVCQGFSSQFETDEVKSDVSAAFPKLHILSHATRIIRNKSTSDNYDTDLGEGLHPQSKDDYETTNYQPGFEDQMLKSYREREIMKRKRADILRNGKDKKMHKREAGNDDAPRVELGSKRHRLSTDTFIKDLPHKFHGYEQQLRIFVYENILGIGTRRLPSSRNLPSLSDTYIIPYRLLRIAYVSLLDSRDGLDLIRSTPNWRRHGARHDFVIVQDGDEGDIWFGQLIHVFMLRINNVKYSIAYIQRFNTRLHRSALTGYIELDDRDERAFIFTDSIVRSCVVLSPGAHENRLVVADLNDADMFFRLIDM
ncbi:hypothetical protein FRC06_010266, partial [Ceratobasidium sp. 370]